MEPEAAGTVLAFDNPWQIAALIAATVSLRLFSAYTGFFDLHQTLKNWRSGILEFIDSLLIALLLVFCVLRPFVIQAFFIPSGSMLPTLQINDRILVNKFIYHFGDPEPGDIVVFRAPPAADHLDRDFIKRVVGTPGDRISIHDGYLYRNGRRLRNPTSPSSRCIGGPVIQRVSPTALLCPKDSSSFLEITVTSPTTARAGVL